MTIKRYLQPANQRVWLTAAALALLTTGIAPAAGEPLPPDFVAFEGNPVLLTGPPGAWDEGATVGPRIVRADGQWYLFYFGMEIAFETPTAIGFATSADGLRWNKAGCNPILDGDGAGFDAEAASDAYVWKEGDTWVMYYGGSGGSPGAPTAVGRATATDPCGPWTRLETPVLEPGSPGEWDWDFVFPDTVLQTEDGYVMYYSASDAFLTSTHQMGMATSPDGLTWTKYDDPATIAPPFAESDPVLTPGAPGAWDSRWTWIAHVRPLGMGWELYYTGSGIAETSIGYATSQDGINWVKDPDNPIFRWVDDPVAIAAGTRALEIPCVIEVGPAQLMYYDYGVIPYYGMGLAISDSDDDSVHDLADNCLLVANADQRDTNGDGFGNRCDADLNGDLTVNFIDLGLFKDVFLTSDPDADFDGNGTVNSVDLGIMKASFFGPPGPGPVVP